MHPRGCSACVPKEKHDTLESLQEELLAIKRHVENLEDMELTKETTDLVIMELIAKKNIIKERMHNLVDTL